MELLLAVAILAILAALAIPRVVSMVNTAKERVCAANIRIVEEGVRRFHGERVAAGLSAEEDLWPHGGEDILTIGDWQADGDLSVHFKKLPPECPFGAANTYELRYIRQDPDDDTSPIVGFTIRCTGNPTGAGH